MTIEILRLEERRHGRRGRVWQAAPWERFEARGVIASAIALAALAASATAGGTVAAGAIGAHAAGSAANTAAAAQSSAMDKQLLAEREATAAQTQANANTLEYTKQQAALARGDAETNREGDYDQWAAREGRMSTLGAALGLPARSIPAYRPMAQDPSNGSGSSSSSGGSTAPKQGEVDWTAPPDKLAQQLTGYFNARGVDPHEVPYWVQQAQTLVQRGQQINDPGYADKRLAAAEVFGGGSGGSSPVGGAAPGSIASMYQAPLTPAYVAPRAPAAGSIRSFATA